MFTNPNLIYHDAFEFCSIPRLFVCLHLRMSSSQQYANVYVKSIFVCPGSIAGVLFDSVRRFRASLLLRTTLCISVVIGLLAVWRHNKPKTKNQKNPRESEGNAPVPQQVPRSWTGSWVLSGWSGACHSLNPVTRSCLRKPRKKERKVPGHPETAQEAVTVLCQGVPRWAQ